MLPSKYSQHMAGGNKHSLSLYCQLMDIIFYLRVIRGSIQFVWEQNESQGVFNSLLLLLFFFLKCSIAPFAALLGAKNSGPASVSCAACKSEKKRNVCDLFTVSLTAYLQLTPGCIYLLSASYQALAVFPVKRRLNHYRDVLAVEKKINK